MNTVIPKEFQVFLEDARAQVNFLLNLIFFAVIIFALSVARLILSLHLPQSFNVNIFKFWEIFTFESLAFASCALCAALLGWLSYELSIEKIYEWGSLVKASFDCYLPDLAKRLGYKLPLTGDEQERFWIAISRRAIFHLPLNPEEWPRADDSDHGSDYNKNDSGKRRENAGEGGRGEADDANGEIVKNGESENSQ